MSPLLIISCLSQLLPLPGHVPSANVLVQKIENTVSSPAQFCSFLNLNPTKCVAIQKKDDEWEKINEIAITWFDSQTDPMWETIVKALIRMEKQGEAKKLAEETGVDYEKAVAEQQ